MKNIEEIKKGQTFKYEDIAGDNMPGRLETKSGVTLVFNIYGIIPAVAKNDSYIALEDGYIYLGKEECTYGGEGKSSVIRELATDRGYDGTVDIKELLVGDWFVDCQVAGATGEKDSPVGLQIIGDHIYVVTNYEDLIAVCTDLGNGNGLVFKIIDTHKLLAGDIIGIKKGQSFNYQELDEAFMPDYLAIENGVELVFTESGFVPVLANADEYVALGDVHIYRSAVCVAGEDKNPILRELANERDYRGTVDIKELKKGDWFVDSQIIGAGMEEDSAVGAKIIGERIYVVTNRKDLMVVCFDMGNTHGLVFEVIDAAQLLLSASLRDEVLEAKRFHAAACLYDQVGKLTGNDQMNINNIMRLGDSGQWAAIIPLFVEDEFEGTSALFEDVFGISMKELNKLADDFGYSRVA